MQEAREVQERKRAGGRKRGGSREEARRKRGGSEEEAERTSTRLFKIDLAVVVLISGPEHHLHLAGAPLFVRSTDGHLELVERDCAACVEVEAVEEPVRGAGGVQRVGVGWG